MNETSTHIISSIIDKIMAERNIITSKPELADTDSVKAALFAIDGCIAIVKEFMNTAPRDYSDAVEEDASARKDEGVKAPVGNGVTLKTSSPNLGDDKFYGFARNVHEIFCLLNDRLPKDVPANRDDIQALAMELAKFPSDASIPSPSCPFCGHYPNTTTNITDDEHLFVRCANKNCFMSSMISTPVEDWKNRAPKQQIGTPTTSRPWQSSDNPVLQQREMLVLDDEEVRQLLNRRYTYWKAAGSYNFDIDGAIEDLRPYLRTTEPTRCKHGVWPYDHCYSCEEESLKPVSVSRERAMEIIHEHNGCSDQDKLEAVLKDAGVKYVD